MRQTHDNFPGASSGTDAASAPSYRSCGSRRATFKADPAVETVDLQRPSAKLLRQQSRLSRFQTEVTEACLSAVRGPPSAVRWLLPMLRRAPMGSVFAPESDFCGAPICERICERNAVKPPRCSRITCHGPDNAPSLTWTSETRRQRRSTEPVAHNPEVHVFDFCGRATGRHVLVSPDIGMGLNLLVLAGRALPEAPRLNVLRWVIDPPELRSHDS